MVYQPDASNHPDDKLFGADDPENELKSLRDDNLERRSAQSERILPAPVNKTYLGAEVYASVVLDMILLTTEDGISETNAIILDAAVADNLLAFITDNRSRL